MSFRQSWTGRFVSVSATLFSAKVGGAIAGFLAHVLLARTLSAQDLGKYFIVVSAISLCAVEGMIALAFALFRWPELLHVQNGWA